ncbi:cilia- and flagella-associated protein 43-like [Denticeps clupeoides]|uniref:cilia- and flagella-associated protein 43-like n=1 Tax=Denticeps clupeoides TaxID=299321 RepID=UPI0010A3A709|nr:cilia- and flagella-associated protein 43-like [Denticeps clupeoides]XP_028810755.1 cilia- and flagella-associated protein 43-like [Denticeps clupeoides]
MDEVGTLHVSWAQGFACNSLAFVDVDTVCYTSGCCVVFLNTESKSRRFLPSPGRGVGALAAEARSGFLAFSEQQLRPSIYVYRYPELALQSQLVGTAHLEYTAVALSSAGPYVASCSSFPDPTITLWNRETGVLLCSHPLAGQNVTTLVFNPMNWHQICAMSSSSVVLWTVERSNHLHMMKASVIDLPAIDGSLIEMGIGSSHQSNGELTYLGPQIPTSAVAGLKGEWAEKFVPKGKLKPRVKPSSVCWSAASQLYVGCREGHLLLVNLNTALTSILFSPHTHAVPAGLTCNNDPPIQAGCFNSLALHKDGLFTAGTDGMLRRWYIKGNHVDLMKTWKLEEIVTIISCSPECEILLLVSNTGCIYQHKTSLSEMMVKVLEVLNGEVVAAVPMVTDNANCVSVSSDGELQVWSMDAGICRGSISVHDQVTTMVSCPVAEYVAVGTRSGHVLFVDLTKKQQPRLVHRVKLFHVQVENLLFDQGGNILIVSSLDPHIFLLDVRPSKDFAVIGYTDAEGAILTLTTQYIRETQNVELMVVYDEARDDGREAGLKEGRLIMLLTLPVDSLTGLSGCADPRGLLNSEILQGCKYEVPQPVSSCAINGNQLYCYCQLRRAIQRFQLPEKSDRLSDQTLVALVPDLELQGHPLGPVTLLLSPHQKWLASVGHDGLLQVRDLTNLDRFMQMQCHSCWLGGGQSLAFSSDVQTVLTTGHRGRSLVCTRLRLSDVEKDSRDTQYEQSLKILAKPSENNILRKMAEWDPETHSPSGSALSHTEEAIESRPCTSVADKDNSLPCSILFTSTWLDNRLSVVMKQESLQFSEDRKDIRRGIKELRNTIQEMMDENETLPEIERMELQEFNLNVDEQRRLQQEGDEEVVKIQNEIELENLAKCYLKDVLRKECWDSLKVKGRSIKAFHTHCEIKNYPMTERTQEELEKLHRVEEIRKSELINTNLQILEHQNRVLVEKSEKDDEEGSEAEGTALKGSISSLYSSNEFLYSQFSVYLREQKINQITLLQDVIYKVKTAFNQEFDAVYKQKQQEINWVREKNKRISKIMDELGIRENLWETTMSDDERPERSLTVEDSEIKVELYLTSEQRERKEEEKKAEKQQLTSKGDKSREHALGYMMGGVLQLRKEGILKMEVPQPEFISKPELQWTEEEKRMFKDYDKKVKELNEEKEKFRKILESEMKKHHESIKETTVAFDETLNKLFEKKIKSDIAISQEDLKIANLAHSILTEEEILNRENDLNYKLQQTKTLKKNIKADLGNHTEEVEAFRETYDNAVAEDKLLDKGFRKEFFDVPGHLVDQLYKLYKRRPRVQRMRTQTDSTIPLKDHLPSNQAPNEGPTLMMKAMEELDSPENMPEGLDLAIWERFCLVRRAKLEKEQQVKIKALTLAEMQAFLQRMTAEDENLSLEIEKLTQDISSLCDDKIRFQQDLMVQILLKQGQVEVESGDFINDYSNSLLLHRSVVEDLNTKIRTLGKQKISIMAEIKDFRKGIIQQEWEHRKMGMLMEDLYNKARDIQTLHVSQNLLEHLREKDHDHKISKQDSLSEKIISLQEKNHAKRVQSCQKLIKQLEMQASMKAKEVEDLDHRLSVLKMAVSERRAICEGTDTEAMQVAEAEARHQKILERKRLIQLARTQGEEVEALRAELNRWRMRSFPCFHQLK